MRTFALLSDNGDCLYLFETLADLTAAVLGERHLEPDEKLIEIEKYTVLATGASKNS